MAFTNTKPRTCGDRERFTRTGAQGHAALLVSLGAPAGLTKVIRCKFCNHHHVIIWSHR